MWNAVDNQARKDHTSIIHGTYSHEETIATASFATTYLIVRNLAEAQYVCNYIKHGGDRDAFLAKFAKAISEGCAAHDQGTVLTLFHGRPGFYLRQCVKFDGGLQNYSCTDSVR